MSLLFYLSYVGIVVAFAFVTLSLASGLLYISELIEEHSKLAKIVGQRGIYIIIGLHAVLYITESLPLKETLFSIFCHFVYLRNFSHTWPVISLTSISFIASCALVIVDHFLWFFYFAHLNQQARHQRFYTGKPSIRPPSFPEVATFFGTCVWLGPLFLFLSLSANDNALPLRSAEPSSPSAHKTRFIQEQTRQPLLRSILSRLPGSKFSRNEGIIASPSLHRSQPAPSAGIHTSSPSVGGMYHDALSPPPRSPGPRQTQGFEVPMSSPNFQLGTPPRRGSPSVRSRVVGGVNIAEEGVGLGLRTSISRSRSFGDTTDED
ncbi:hypothetical protein D9757_001349 [Collybiopsis confluens]|uniref:DUF396-domain-containing protein n=1 Tax=Collybiopsis confluens TaxID=2823264 RepID=A0A8H5I0P1_9AGAR|nr:hypothetical protein D9757_001349 [Collybiopsis confluens]